MTTYAVVQTGGKQYQVSPGDVIDVELLDADEGATVHLEDVRMIAGGAELLLGSPQVPNAHVVAQVQEQRKGPKLIVFKYKAKKHYRKKNGHRQRYTRLLISGIFAEGQTLAETDEAVAPLPVVEVVAEEAEAAVVEEAVEEDAAEAEAAVVEEPAIEEPAEGEPTGEEGAEESQKTESAEGSLPEAEPEEKQKDGA